MSTLRGELWVNKMPELALYKEYSRQDVHDIFSPDTRFTPSSGTWGLHGIIENPNSPGDFVFFVTFGQHQAGHTFDEWITEEGVFSWQSQPRQNLQERKIQQFIHHDANKNSIYFFLRTQRKAEYTYMGRLKYLKHDPYRNNPVHIYWKLVDWPIPVEVLSRISLRLRPANNYSRGTFQTMEPIAEYDHGNTNFIWRGQTWQVDYQALISRVKDWIDRGLPTKATRYKDWYVDIDGQRISPSWLFHLITGAGYYEFDRPLAREKLSKIGFEAVSVEKNDIRINSSGETDDLFSLIIRKRQSALDNLAQLVQNELHTRFQLDNVRTTKNAKSLELRFANLKGFYGITFKNSIVEFGYFFPGKSHKAQLIVEKFKPTRE